MEEAIEAARIPAAVRSDSNQHKKKNVSGQHAGKTDLGQSEPALNKQDNRNMQADRQKKSTKSPRRWLPTLAETLARGLSKEVADKNAQLEQNKKQNVEVIDLTAEESPSPELDLRPLIAEKRTKQANQEVNGQQSRRTGISTCGASNLTDHMQEANQPSSSGTAPDQCEAVHPSRRRLLEGDKIISTCSLGESVAMEDKHGEIVSTHEEEIASKLQPAKARAIYLSVCLSKSDIQLPNPIPQPTRLKIKGTDACVKGRRISKLLSKKHNDDTWDTGNDIVYAPKNLPSKTQPAGFSSEPIIYWDALLNNSVVHGHRVKLVSRITAMSLEHQWRAVRVWAEWVQNKGVNIAGEQMKRQAIDVGNYLEASKEYMELLRAS